MIERRKYMRLPVKKGAFALLRTSIIDLNRIKEMSMGEIAFSVLKSDAVKIGQIKDASIGGLSFSYIDNNGESVKTSQTITVLEAEQGLEAQFRGAADPPRRHGRLAADEQDPAARRGGQRRRRPGVLRGHHRAQARRRGASPDAFRHGSRRGRRVLDRSGRPLLRRE